MNGVIASVALATCSAIGVYVLSACSKATTPPTVEVRGQTIRIGDLSDNVFRVFGAQDKVETETGPDAKHPGGPMVRHTYQVDGKIFSITFAREEDPGPYRVVNIEY